MSEALDKLGGQDAPEIREVSVMVAKDGPLADEQLQEIRRAATRHLKRWSIPQDLVAHKLGTNKTYMSNFLSGNFGQIPKGTLQKLAREVNDWVELDNRRQLHEVDSAFVHTKVAERLIKVARHAVETRDIVVAHGPAGCGKTVTLLELRKLIPASIYLYITPDHARKAGFQRGLYQAVWEHRPPARPTLSDVLERLKFSDRLLMLDNADLIHPDVFPVIMSLHDVAEIPILIAGTFRLLQKLTHDNDSLRGQMASRIGMRAELLSEQTAPRRGGRAGEWIRAEEIRAIFERGQIKLHPATVARLKAIANHSVGRLRRCERYLRYAQLLLPRQRGEVLITEELLEQAILLVDGEPLPAAPTGRVLESEAATA
ncbi:MAG: ATP-binding protein [Planctomycetota bacterium]